MRLIDCPEVNREKPLLSLKEASLVNVHIVFQTFIVTNEDSGMILKRLDFYCVLMLRFSLIANYEMGSAIMNNLPQVGF